MKKLLLFPLLAVLLSFTAFHKKTEVTSLDGKWREYWAVGDEDRLGVGYNDEYELYADESKNYIITCPERENYLFRNVEYLDERLTFLLINTNHNDTLPYSLKLGADGKEMNGTAYSVDDDLVKVKWKKVE